MSKLETAISLLEGSHQITFLTGAGISAESGIPTFRGKDGFWVKGSKNYTPQDIATFAFFSRHPLEVLEWYKERQHAIKQVKPNAGHYAITDIEKWATKHQKKFLVVTQNIDNLHQRAGTVNVAEIHGNIFEFRCSSTFSIDKHVLEIERLDLDNVENLDNLVCRTCGSYLRPNVLWFDEIYDNRFFDINKSLNHFKKSDLVFVVGTTLQTTLPYRMVGEAIAHDIPLIEINPDPVLLDYAKVVFDDRATSVLQEIAKRLS